MDHHELLLERPLPIRDLGRVDAQLVGSMPERDVLVEQGSPALDSVARKNTMRSIASIARFGGQRFWEGELAALPLRPGWLTFLR
jgi:hypothetical protein